MMNPRTVSEIVVREAPAVDQTDWALALLGEHPLYLKIADPLRWMNDLRRVPLER
jgi:hypothetical protein